MPLYSLTTRHPRFAPLRLLTILCLPAYAAAQYGYYDGGGTPGRVVAGIVVAICIAILFFILFSIFFRRRRRGVPILPWQGNSNVPLRPHNPNQTPYTGTPMMAHQSSFGPSSGHYQPPPGPPPSSDPMPPPPYPGKPPAYDSEENNGYGAPPGQPTPDAPQPGGFVAPQSPHSPPAAHVNNHSHSPWFRNS
ncbi:hypothetical protein OH77DRAFT_1518868 [Trametes cingulata]|nr:hypothetical protein OH77DRAFT_1518868 [Trametes cingulata]